MAVVCLSYDNMAVNRAQQPTSHDENNNYVTASKGQKLQDSQTSLHNAQTGG